MNKNTTFYIFITNKTVYSTSYMKNVCLHYNHCRNFIEVFQNLKHSKILEPQIRSSSSIYMLLWLLLISYWSDLHSKVFYQTWTLFSQAYFVRKTTQFQNSMLICFVSKELCYCKIRSFGMQEETTTTDLLNIIKFLKYWFSKNF